MPVHIRDMESLPYNVQYEFETCSHWVISKTIHKFSAIPFDQPREQENKIGSGGAVVLTENPIAFRRWMLSGLELARLLQLFEEDYLPDDSTDNPRNYQHHLQGLSAQKTFQKKVDSLLKNIQQMGNRFLDVFF